MTKTYGKSLDKKCSFLEERKCLNGCSTPPDWSRFNRRSRLTRPPEGKVALTP